MRLVQGEKGASRGVHQRLNHHLTVRSSPTLNPANGRARVVPPGAKNVLHNKKGIRNQLRPKSVLQPTDSDKDALTQYLLLRPVFFVCPSV